MKRKTTGGAEPKAILDTLLDLLNDRKSSPATKVAAAKILLDRAAPKDNEEAKQRDAEERQAAIAEARALLAELTVAKSDGLSQPVAVVEDGAAESVDAAGRGKFAFDVIG